MNRVITITLVAIVGFLSTAAQSAPITIDFDDLALGGSPLPGDLVVVNTEGYRFYSEAGVSDFFDPGGNQVILGFSSGIDLDTGEISMSRQDNAAFALYAADLTGVSFYIASSDDGNFDSLTGPGLNELGTGAWLNISSVVFFGDSTPFAAVSLDNVVVGAAVPVPAALWLFGSALVGLGWLRR